jgi:hypothetical protein
METTSAVEELDDRKVAEMVAEEATKQLEDVLDEVVDLAKNTEFKQSTKDELATSSEDPAEELNDETLPMDDLELDMDLAEESTEPQTGVEPVAEETESAPHRLIDTKSEIEVEAVDGHVGQASTPLGSDGQLASLLSKKIDATLTCLVEERLSAVVERIIVDKINRVFASVG